MENWEKSHTRLNGNSHMENYLMHPADHVQNKIFMETIFHFLETLMVVEAIPSGSTGASYAFSM